MRKQSLLVLIITCWVTLVIALIAKLLGYDIFYPSVNNQTFIKMCEYIDNNVWIKYTISCVISLILNSLSILAILGQKFYTKTQAIIFIPLMIAMSIVGWYSQIANIIIGVVICLLPIIWLKKRWYRVLIGVGLILLFQIISIVTKSIGHWNLNEEYTLVAMILQIDSMIMTLLYYLYSNYIILKENK